MTYWLYYSSEEWSARILKVPNDWKPHSDPGFAGHYRGPFKTLKEARTLGRQQIRGDINEMKMMLEIINGKPSEEQ